MKLNLDHVHLYSQQPAAAAVTYCDTFGAERIGEAQTPNGLRVILNLAGTRIYIEQAPADRSGIDHMAFATPDLDAALTEIAANGGRILTPARDVGPELRIAFVETPDGGRIEILQRGLNQA